QPAVYGAEGELAAPGTRGSPPFVTQQPLELGGREVGIEDEPGLSPDPGFEPLALERGAALAGAAVLPDGRARHGLAALALPQQRGLALVGDADRRDLPAVGRAQRIAEGGEHARPDLLALVLHPAGTREVLRQLGVAAPLDLAARVQQE